MELAADWSLEAQRARYAAIRARVAPMALVRTPVVMRPPIAQTIYAEPIGPQFVAFRARPSRGAINARPDLARKCYGFPLRIRRPGRRLHHEPIGPKMPAALRAAQMGVGTGGGFKPVEVVIREEMEVSGLTLDDVMQKSKRQKFCDFRQRLYWRLRHESGLSFPKIGKLVGRDHTTICHGVARYQEIIDEGRAQP